MQKRYLVYLDNKRSYSAENLKGLLQDQTKALVLLSETHCQEFSIFKPKKFFLNGKIYAGYIYYNKYSGSEYI